MNIKAKIPYVALGMFFGFSLNFFITPYLLNKNFYILSWGNTLPHHFIQVEETAYITRDYLNAEINKEYALKQLDQKSKQIEWIKDNFIEQMERAKIKDRELIAGYYDDILVELDKVKSSIEIEDKDKVKINFESYLEANQNYIESSTDFITTKATFGLNKLFFKEG